MPVYYPEVKQILGRPVFRKVGGVPGRDRPRGRVPPVRRRRRPRGRTSSRRSRARSGCSSGSATTPRPRRSRGRGSSSSRTAASWWSGGGSARRLGRPSGSANRSGSPARAPRSVPESVRHRSYAVRAARAEVARSRPRPFLRPGPPRRSGARCGAGSYFDAAGTPASRSAVSFARSTSHSARRTRASAAFAPPPPAPRRASARSRAARPPPARGAPRRRRARSRARRASERPRPAGGRQLRGGPQPVALCLRALLGVRPALLVARVLEPAAGRARRRRAPRRARRAPPGPAPICSGASRPRSASETVATAARRRRLRARERQRERHGERGGDARCARSSQDLSGGSRPRGSPPRETYSSPASSAGSRAPLLLLAASSGRPPRARSPRRRPSARPGRAPFGGATAPTSPPSAFTCARSSTVACARGSPSTAKRRRDPHAQRCAGRGVEDELAARGLRPQAVEEGPAALRVVVRRGLAAARPAPARDAPPFASDDRELAGGPAERLAVAGGAELEAGAEEPRERSARRGSSRRGSGGRRGRGRSGARGRGRTARVRTSCRPCRRSPGRSRSRRRGPGRSPRCTSNSPVAAWRTRWCSTARTRRASSPSRETVHSIAAVQSNEPRRAATSSGAELERGGGVVPVERRGRGSAPARGAAPPVAVRARASRRAASARRRRRGRGSGRAREPRI